MSRPRRSVAALALAILCGWGSIALACTSIVVSRGASKDGSVMVTYSADAPFMPRLLRVPGGDASGRGDGPGPGLGERPGSAAR